MQSCLFTTINSKRITIYVIISQLTGVYGLLFLIYISSFQILFTILQLKILNNSPNLVFFLVFIVLKRRGLF